MAVVLKTTAPSRDVYEQLVAIVGSEAPPGCIVHTASEVDGEVRVVDVWESRQHVEDFFQTKLGPAFAQVRVEGQPPELTDTFRIERG
jgi:quinol monooxygenase YgiN